MAGVARLFDGHIQNKSNGEVNLYSDEYRGQIIGLYFSAYWYILFDILFSHYI